MKAEQFLKVVRAPIGSVLFRLLALPKFSTVEILRYTVSDIRSCVLIIL